MSSYDVVDLIRAKRDGRRLGPDEIDWLIAAYTAGEVAEEQMAAMAMAIVFRGLDAAELTRWTEAMIDTGERMSFAGLNRPVVDKHSTGGVGDMITLPLAPIVAACGAAVPQLSGRGLGHTGGTLDKLEAIPGWSPDVEPGDLIRLLDEVGAVICAPGPGLAPADRKLYALRDVTGTVESIPLIASSIMSKKIAEGTPALVLDVKTGSGAFMRQREQAVELARTMVGLGRRSGVATVALVTSMAMPLGRAAGNAVEVAQAVEVLNGRGPSDVVELTLALAREMLTLAGLDADPAEALASGRALQTWRAMIRGQGGDPDAALPRARHQRVIEAPRDGFLTRLDALAVGVAAWRLGAGRARKEDPVQAAAGVLWHAGVGERVRAGQPLFTLLTDTPERFDRAAQALEGGWSVGDEPGEPQPLLLERIAG
ncbi:thymidine phosphorylase [Micropruina sonneratiae]|uniref:thymidine phosphorylase n=1 Tax=Micropruina sonneratiae TaxID=2986940 RepID=UPI002225D9A3|nr:thymidine phosphorylase [Micropruina sp. KQZ13P-5]MCW3157926.1 thymidine phosphorylase [Micropruina sp. KQZ13P-5]